MPIERLKNAANAAFFNTVVSVGLIDADKLSCNADASTLDIAQGMSNPNASKEHNR